MTSKIENRLYTLGELSKRMKLSDKGARSWIKNYFPEMYIPGKNKSFFTAREAEKIINEFEL